MLNTVEPDECCCEKLVQQLGAGFQGQVWTCPKCGMKWEATVYKLDMGDHITHWTSNPEIMLIE